MSVLLSRSLPVSASQQDAHSARKFDETARESVENLKEKNKFPMICTNCTCLKSAKERLFFVLSCIVYVSVCMYVVVFMLSIVCVCLYCLYYLFVSKNPEQFSLNKLKVTGTS